jgi:hypothetical protein
MHRGDSPTFGVVLVAVLLVIVALMGMAGTPARVAPLVIDEVQYSVEVLETYIWEEYTRMVVEGVSCTTCTGVDLKARIQERMREVYLTNTNFFGKIRSGDFSVSVDDEGHFVVDVTDIWVEAHEAGNSVKRTFGLEIRVDDEGTVVRNIYKENIRG